METELISFKDIVGEEESPDDLKVDELYSQLEALFGEISLNKKCKVIDDIEELDKTTNEGLKLKTQPQIEKQNQEFLDFAGSDESEVMNKALESIDKNIEQMAYSEIFGG